MVGDCLHVELEEQDGKVQEYEVRACVRAHTSCCAEELPPMSSASHRRSKLSTLTRSAPRSRVRGVLQDTTCTGSGCSRGMAVLARPSAFASHRVSSNASDTSSVSLDVDVCLGVRSSVARSMDMLGTARLLCHRREVILRCRTNAQLLKGSLLYARGTRLFCLGNSHDKNKYLDELCALYLFTILINNIVRPDTGVGAAVAPKSRNRPHFVWSR